MKWGLGVYLGTLMKSNECYVGLPNGHVTRARGIARVRPDERWSADAISKITGTPAKPHDGVDDCILEGYENQHLLLDDHELKLLEGDDQDAIEGLPPALRPDRALPSRRITRLDLHKYRPSDGCLRCTEISMGNHQTNANHDPECRRRIYTAMWFAKDPNLLRWLEQHQHDHRRVYIDSTATLDIENAPPSVRAAVPGKGPADAASPSRAPAPMPPTPAAPVEDANELVVLDEFADVVSLLVDHGVEPVAAQMHVTNLVKPHKQKSTFAELYGRGGLTATAKTFRNFDCAGLRIVDLTASKPNGDPWDFSLRADRTLAEPMIESDDPDWLVGAPTCTAWSMLNFWLNYQKMNPKYVERKLTDAKVHIDFCCRLYRRQLARGRWFLHEHPREAKSWKRLPIQRLLRIPEVLVTRCHQCQYGATAPSPDGKRLPILKPTRFMSNSHWMLSQLSRLCKRDHVHQHLVDGRAADSAFYPLGLMKAILRGMQLTRDATQKTKDMQEEEYDTVLSLSINALSPETHTTTDNKPLATDTMPSVDGNPVPIFFEPVHFRETYLDEYTREPLPRDLVRQAIIEELKYFNSRVRELDDAQRVMANQDSKVIRTRWVMTNKGGFGEAGREGKVGGVRDKYLSNR